MVTIAAATKFAFALDGLIRSRVKGHGDEEYARQCIHDMAQSLDELFRTAYVKDPPEKDLTLGSKGRWYVETNDEGVPFVVAKGMGRFQDEQRTVAVMKDGSILSYEDAELIVKAVKSFRET